jgi:lipid II:glycine glycyltransferase (peptidoglycan interpeptide bridge formation enzyme)
LVQREADFCLLQSWEWGQFKERLGWKALRLGVEAGPRLVAGAQVLVKRLPLGVASLAYVPRGPVGNWLEGETSQLLLCELRRVARRFRALILRVEPGSACTSVLRRHGFRSWRSTNQPRATIVVDLAPRLDDVLARMHAKTRYNIRYAARKGVVVSRGAVPDLPEFFALMRITARRTGFRLRSREYYAHEWHALAATEQIALFVARHGDQTLAVNVSAVCGRHAAYLHGASSGTARNLMPNHLLMWEAMRWAKEKGCTSFDLWGIPDEIGLAAQTGQPLPTPVRTDGLWGVYRFKRGFGTEVRSYPSAHDLLYPCAKVRKRADS